MKWLILALGFSITTAHAQELSPQRQTELQYLLTQDCGSCHGLTLRGGLGPPLLPENLAGKSVEYLRETILQGRPGTAMPPWRGLLSDADAEWLARRLVDGL